VWRLLAMESLWKERAKPVPVDLAALNLPEASTLADEEQRVWSAAAHPTLPRPDSAS
jgi:hypothetical protein